MNTKFKIKRFLGKLPFFEYTDSNIQIPDLIYSICVNQLTMVECVKIAKFCKSNNIRYWVGYEDLNRRGVISINFKNDL
jgi:hypothetical protein